MGRSFSRNRVREGSASDLVRELNDSPSARDPRRLFGSDGNNHGMKNASRTVPHGSWVVLPLSGRAWPGDPVVGGKKQGGLGPVRPPSDVDPA
jgi:hypothetical protein